MDELTKDLLQTRRHLQAIEEEKRGTEEEAEVVRLFITSQSPYKVDAMLDMHE